MAKRVRKRRPRRRGPAKRGGTISLCMIVKNEARFLGRCLAGARDVVDQMVVVDTGSTDATVAIGSTSERDFAAPDTTDAQLDDLIARVRAVCPDLAAAPVLERWAGVRPRSPSRAPMLGPWPGRDGQFVLNGGFKIGFGMAPRLAELAADLLLDGADAIPQGFRVSDNLG